MPDLPLPLPGPTGSTSTLRQRVRALLIQTGVEREFWPREVARAVARGLLPFEALEGLHNTPEPPPCRQPPVRLPPRTRRLRWDERPDIPTRRFVRAISLDAALDWSIGDGAARCLQIVVSLAGGIGRPLVTLSSSIARQLGRDRRTISNYWRDLRDAGFITHAFDRRTGLVTVVVTDLAAPMRAPDPATKPRKVWPRLPRSGFWRRNRGGAKKALHIKEESTYPAVPSRSVAARDAIEREVRQTEDGWVPSPDAPIG